jgi:PAS domain-containing protein
MDPQTFGQLVGAIAALAGVLWGAYGWLMPRLQPWLDKRRAKSVRGTLARMEAGQNTIMAQLFPNGGGSLRDRVEEGIRISTDNTALIESLTDSSMDGYADVAEDGRWTRVNATLARWLQVGTSPMIGWGWINCIRAQQRADLRDSWDDAIEEQRELHCEVEMVGADRQAIPTEWVLRPLTRNPDGSPRLWRLQIRRLDQRTGDTGRHPAVTAVPRQAHA